MGYIQFTKNTYHQEAEKARDKNELINRSEPDTSEKFVGGSK